MKKQYIFAFISIILWATSATVTKLLVADLTNMQVLAGANFFASLSLIILNIFQKKLNIIKTYKIKDYLNFAILGFLGIFVYYAMYNGAINLLQAQEAFVINYLWPIMIMLFAILILKEKFSINKLIALVTSFIGVIIIGSGGNILNIQYDNMLGVLMAVVAAISYGLFSVLVKRKNYDITTLMLFCYIASFIISIIYLGFNFPSLNIYQILGFIWIGAFTQGIAYITWALALKTGDTAKVSNLAFITPIISTIFTVAFLKEQIHLYFIIGFAFILLGIIIQSKQKENFKAKE